MGKDPAKWASHVNCYHAVEYSNIYNGIDIRVYQDSFSLKYDFIIGQGGKPGDIKMLYDGVNRIFIDDGNLVVRTSVNELVEKQPYAYQLIDGVETKVNCEFVLKNNIVSFKTGNYRKDLPLIIDPVLIFSSYSGSYSNNFGYTASYDAEGHLYSGSTAFGPDYPLTNGAFQTSYAGDTDPSNINHGTDVAITKWEIDGTDLIYSTLLGGDKDELPHSIYLDSEGSLYVYGTTGSANFPVSADGYDQSYNGGTAFNPVGLGVGFPTGSDIFVSKLSPDGSALLGSTYLGGSLNDGLNIGTLKYNYADEVRGEVLLDYKGNVYIVSSTLSSNFPIVGGFQPNSAGGLEGCVVKLKNDLSSILWSSYVGGTGTDAAYSIVLDSDNNIYISGGTNSNNFPTTSGTLYPNYIGGLSDAFVTKISEDGSGILVSSYYGSVAYDQAYFVELNSNDEVYLFGQTTASGSTLIQNAVYGTPGSGQFISVLSSDLDQVIRSTVFGTGNGVNISPTAFLVDVCNKIYICGWGGGTNQPGLGNGGWTYGMEVTGPPNQAYQSTTDGSDFYLAVFEDDLSAIHYGTFMGGNMSHEHVDGGTSRFSKTGKIYEAVCAGCNYSAGVPPGNSDFPTYPNPGAWSNTNNHYCNLAVLKFDFLLPLTIADFSLPLHVCAPYQHYFNNLSYNATDYYWDFGDGTYSTDSIPVHMFDSVGSYTVMLIASNTNSCNFTDTAYHYIHVHDISINVPGDTSICQGQNVIFNVQSSEPNAEYVFSTHINFSDTINSNTSSGYLAVQPSVTTTYYISVSGTYCDKQDSVTVWVRNANIYAGADTAICYGDTIALFANNLVPGDILDYQWNNIPTIISGDTTGNPLVYPLAGTMYSVTVINQYGCQDIDSVFVQVNNVNLVNDNHQDVICFGDCDGMAGVTASGSSSFTYQWDNNMTGAIIQDLCPGTYTVVATDNIGCTATISVTITEPPLLEAAITEIVNTVCDSVNGNIGTATVTPWGGSPGYTYLWSDNQDDSTAIALYAGNYQVVVTDSHGCDTTLTVQIDDGSNLEINTNSYDAYCYGVCDGGASVTVTQAGTPPYTYGWDNGQSMSTADSLCAGMHYVTVVDADFCFRVDYFVIQQPGPLLP
ncbi:MAG: SBBP repeat-containing protein, partial [Bacteroidota bacterium]